MFSAQGSREHRWQVSMFVISSLPGSFCTTLLGRTFCDVPERNHEAKGRLQVWSPGCGMDLTVVPKIFTTFPLALSILLSFSHSLFRSVSISLFLCVSCFSPLFWFFSFFHSLSRTLSFTFFLCFPLSLFLSYSTSFSLSFLSLLATVLLFLLHTSIHSLRGSVHGPKRRRGEPRESQGGRIRNCEASCLRSRL